MTRLRYIRLSRHQRVRIWVAIALISLTALLWAILLHLRPILVNVATARCSNTVNRIVVAAVNDAVASGHLEYGKLVSFDKDAEGHVAALRSDMAAFNRLQTEVADDVLARLSEVSATELAIPLGTLTGSPLLAGRGPKLYVKMETLGTASARFSDLHRRRHQSDEASDTIGGGCLRQHSAAGHHHLHQGQQRDLRGGDGHCRRCAADVHLLQHHRG